MKRNTRQRDIVTRALEGMPGFVSAQDLHLHIQAGGETIGLATVYRTLASLAAEGGVDALAAPDGTSVYRACVSDEHHHHLICRRCGQTREIEAQPVEIWAREVAAAHGYTQARHVVDIFGLCPSCSLDWRESSA